MDNFILALEKSIITESWHTSLVLALTMPDICSKYCYPEQPINKIRYSDWFNDYVLIKYTSQIGPDHNEHTFLTGNDCYALRCSLLHEGQSQISHQRSQDILDDFVFVQPPKFGNTVHCNLIDEKLQLQIDVFSHDILQSCKEWWNVLSDEDKQAINLKTT